jgi:hypothetical protein
VFLFEILCEREGDELFYQKKCVGGKKCDRCGNISLFHSKYPIDMNDQSFSNIIVNWKRYEYISSTTPHSSNACWCNYMHNILPNINYQPGFTISRFDTLYVSITDRFLCLFSIA